jgi:aryl-alcohol dehydrogenase-like predicted oxidoreductase
MAYGISNVRGQVSTAEVAAILGRALEAGVQTIDTAAAYGNAEDVLAGALQGRRDFRIVSKTLRISHGLKAVEDRVRRSAEILGTPIDTMLVHSAGDLLGTDGENLWMTLMRLRDGGLVRRIGISAYAADDPLMLAKRFQPQVFQLPVSLLDQRLVTDGTLASLKSAGIELHVRSVFLQGLLLMQPEEVPVKLAHAVPDLKRVRALIAASGATPLEAALGFVLQRPEIDDVVVGVTGIRELDEILAAAMVPSPTLDWHACGLNDPVLLDPSLW